MEWDVIRCDLESLAEVEVREGEQWYLLLTTLQGVTGKVLQAVRVAVPPASGATRERCDSPPLRCQNIKLCPNPRSKKPFFATNCRTWDKKDINSILAGRS